MATKTVEEFDPKIPLHAAKAVVTLYYNQTPDEQLTEATYYRNGVGYNGADAAFGSSLARQLLENRPLTRNQLAACEQMLPKYRQQLVNSRWWEITLPDRVGEIMENWGQPKKKSPKPVPTDPNAEGVLTLDKDGRLEFVPNVYPTKVLKQHGWKKGDQPYWTWVTHFNLGAVNTVTRLWPTVELDDQVNTLVAQALEGAELPDHLEKHPILFPFQKEAISFLHGSPKAMLALAPGLGKTACSLFAADIAPNSDRILIVAPLTLVWNWRAEIRKWLDEDSVQWHGGKPELWPEGDRWIVTNYATVSRNLEAVMDEYWDIVIVDESILVKNRKAQRTQAIKKLAKSVERCWLLSGSPTSRFYDDMWAQLNLLDQKRFSSYWRFTRTYCEVFDNGWGLQITGNKAGAAEALQQDLADIYFCRTQDQVLDLPDWVFESYEIPLYPDQWQKYRQMEERFWADLGEGDIVLSPNVLSQLTRLIQIASNPSIIGGKGKAAKWDAAVDMLEWVPMPAIIWTNFIETGNRVAELLRKRKYKTAVLTGQTKQADREHIVTEFQNGELDVIVAHPKVGKFGLTLTAGRTAIYLERNYEADNYYQSLHRVRRIGTTVSPLIIHLLATDPDGHGARTVDHVIDNVLRYRKDSSIALTSALLLSARQADEK